MKKNIALLERELTAKKEEARALHERTAKACNDDGNRLMTAEERGAIQGKLDEALAIKKDIAEQQADAAMLDEIDRLTAGMTPPATSLALPRNGRLLSMGEQFVTAAEYDFFKKGQHRVASSWRSPGVELIDHGDMQATTLTTDSASGGALILPDYRPGIQPILYKRLVVADLLSSGTTDSNLIAYMRETAFTNNADTVLEGGEKPESALTFDAVSDPVRKIAHWLPVTEEMLEDVSQIRSYIDSRLRLGVRIVEEDQLLNGSGVAPDILGLRLRAGLAADVVRTDPETNADAMLRQTMAIYATSFLMPDGYVLHPTNWMKVILTKTTTGEYLAGGPFSPIHAPTLWGLPVAVTPSITLATGLVGAFKTAAQVFRKGGIRVEASNSHADFFIKNLVAIRAEERLALAVYRPQAIGEVTALL